ncbi:hypothetical protein J6590_000620 [Homalodisca vitripennis]|nr:hypothetical protein J6590_000620 [Homalodisca vitripennis]
MTNEETIIHTGDKLPQFSAGRETKREPHVGQQIIEACLRTIQYNTRFSVTDGAMFFPSHQLHAALSRTEITAPLHGAVVSNRPRLTLSLLGICSWNVDKSSCGARNQEEQKLLYRIIMTRFDYCGSVRLDYIPCNRLRCVWNKRQPIEEYSSSLIVNSILPIYNGSFIQSLKSISQLPLEISCGQRDKKVIPDSCVSHYACLNAETTKTINTVQQ